MKRARLGYEGDDFRYGNKTLLVDERIGDEIIIHNVYKINWEENTVEIII